LTLDRVILHTIVHHSWTSTYTPDFIEIEETVCGRTDGRRPLRTHVRTHGRTDGRTDERTDGHLRTTSLGRRFRIVDLKSLTVIHCLFTLLYYYFTMHWSI